MADEGFHEIQLSGKHLVALFMAAAVVLVVAFLLGAQVGRGVRNQKEGPLAGDAVVPQAPPPPADAAATGPPAEPAAKADAAQSDAPAKPVEADLSYYSRLEGQPGAGAAKAGPAPKDAAKTDPAPRDAAKAAPKDPAAAPSAKTPDAATAAKAPDAAAAAGTKADGTAAAPGDPAGASYVVKVAAYKERGQADTVAARLVDKGYTAYVVPSSVKGTALYSVRVGKFKTRKEADAIKARLEKEERFKPLITR
jgi:cell division septation protein DedD